VALAAASMLGTGLYDADLMSHETAPQTEIRMYKHQGIWTPCGNEATGAVACPEAYMVLLQRVRCMLQGFGTAPPRTDPKPEKLEILNPNSSQP
jgi:hypothetical protein